LHYQIRVHCTHLNVTTFINAKAEETANIIAVYEEFVTDLRQLTNTAKASTLSPEEQAKRKERREKRKQKKAEQETVVKTP